MANLRAGAPGAHEPQPRWIGGRDRRRDDLDHVAVLEFGAQRHLLVVDLGGGGAVAHIAVDGVGKVHHGRAPGQGHDLALGGKHIDRIGEQVHLHVVPELGGVAGLVLDVQQRLQPLGAQAFGRRAITVLRLVQPVRGHASLGNDVHFVGAHLELDVHARGADQRGVQRLVAIELGNGDMVFELSGHRLVHLVQHPERRIAVGDGGHNHPKAIDIRDLREAQMLEVHLLVDGVQGFFTACQTHLHADLGEGRVHFGLHLLHQVPAAVARLVDGLRQCGIAPGVQVPERQVLQFTVGLVQPQAVRDGGVDLQCFRRNAAPFAARHVRQRAHVVRAVGQLDEDDAHVARHGQQHLAEGLGLVLFAGVELQLVQLGQAVHQFSHGGAKAVDQIGLGDAAVFHGVVQQGGHQGLGVELPGGALGRHGNRVGDVGLATVAQLAQVGLVSKTVRLAHLFDAGCVQIVEAVCQRGKAGRRCVGGGCCSREVACRWQIARPGLRCRR